jgi:hypothetical protein
METITIIIILILICICISSSIGVGIYISSSSSSNDTDSDTGETAASNTTSGGASGGAASVFKIVGSSDTNFEEEGGGNSIYLDRQNIDCKNNAIKRFHLVRDGAGKIKYEVTCSSGDLGSSTNKDTGANDWGGGNSVYLDRHNIECGSDSVLSQFHLSRPSDNQIRYDYTCKKSNKPLTCRDVTTPANEDGGGNMIVPS